MQRPNAPHPRLAALLVSVAWTLGCPGVEDPCEADRLGCDDNAAQFELLTCEISGDLSVVPGHGENHFAALSDGAPLTVHFGSQGGMHTFLGFSASGADPEASPLLRATFQLVDSVVSDTWEGSGSPPPPCLQPPFAWEEDDGTPRCWLVGAARTVVLGARDPLRQNDAGDVEEFGLLVVLDTLPVASRLLVTVEDQCGRIARGWVDVTFR